MARELVPMVCLNGVTRLSGLAVYRAGVTTILVTGTPGTNEACNSRNTSGLITVSIFILTDSGLTNEIVVEQRGWHLSAD